MLHLLSLAIAPLLAAPAAETRPQPLNVVMILADDQAYGDFGFMGNHLVQTPCIDRLAAASAVYTQGYVPSSVCRPSLATLLTGLYPHQHGIYFNHPPPGNAALGRLGADEYYAARGRAEKLIQAVPALPRLLAQRGYDCLQTGKYWEGHYRTGGFTQGMTTGRAAGVPGCWDKTLPDGTVVAHGNGDAGLTIGRSTMQPLEEFIDAHAQPGAAPFLIWYAPVLPHEPHNPPERLLKLYRDRPDVPPQYAAYWANCTWFDETVGWLLDRLQQRGLAENTVFVFVSDNGWAPAEKPNARTRAYAVDRRSKRSPFDSGLRTPILIRCDGRVEAARFDTPCSTVDVVPTLLDALGLKGAMGKLPGRSLWPSATGRQPLDPAPVFGEIYPGDATSLRHPERDVAYRWVRDGRLKLVVPQRHGGSPPWGGYLDAPAMFDVVADPEETTNLAGQPDYAADRARLNRLLDAWWTPGEKEHAPAK